MLNMSEAICRHMNLTYSGLENQAFPRMLLTNNIAFACVTSLSRASRSFHPLNATSSIITTKFCASSTMQMSVGRTATVTGASGFIGGHLVQQLLHNGYNVRALVRDPAAPSVAHLHHLRSLYPSAVSLAHVPDLCEPSQTMTDAFRDREFVFHVANPIGPSAENLDDDSFINISVRAVETVLRSAAEAGVSRVVVTSSMAAVCGSQTLNDPGHVYTEADWNDDPTSRYSKAKTRAEQAAWSVSKELPKLELSVVLPSLVLGPPLKHQPPRSSNTRLYALATGDAKRAGLRPAVSGIVHISDCIAAHIAAAEEPSAAGQRYITSLPDQYTVLELAAVVAKHFPDLDVPTQYVDEAKDAPRVSTRKPSSNNSKLEKLLGRPLLGIDDIVKDGINSMIALGYIPRPMEG